MKSIILLFGIVLFYNCSARKKESKGDNPSESIEEIILEITKPIKNQIQKKC